MVFLLFLLAPAVSLASVQINEIAWMGTVTSANDEWLELYNPDSAAVDLTNWTLSWALTATSPKVVGLSGSLPTRGHYLLERTSDTTISGVTADLIYVGALANGGETLVLKDASGTTVDTVDGSNGWKIGSDMLAGNNTTKATAQRAATGWITATSTPRAVNATTASVVATTTSAASASTTTSAGSSASEDEEEMSTISAHGGSVALSDVRKVKPQLLVTPGRVRIGTIHAPLTFTAAAYDQDTKTVRDAHYLWSFGDGSTGEGPVVHHSYRLPGEYIVVLTASRNELAAIGRTTVVIEEPHVRVVGARPGFQSSWIELENKGGAEVNLGNWHLQSGEQSFLIPRDTIVGTGKRLALPFEHTRLAVGERTIRLLYPHGEPHLGSEWQLAATSAPIVALALATSSPLVLVATTAPTQLTFATSTTQLLSVGVAHTLASIQAQAATLMLAVAREMPVSSSARSANSVRPTKVVVRRVLAAATPTSVPPARALVVSMSTAEPPRTITISKPKSSWGRVGSFFRNLLP